MAVFIGDGKIGGAVECALKVDWATRAIVNAKVQEAYPSRNFEFGQRVGIDTSELFVTRTGIRGSNDLVWVGTATNDAANLDPRYPSYITADVYRYLNSNSQFGRGGIDMWTDLGTARMGYRIYGSSWSWEF